MRVFLTGASGFIGRAIGEALNARGAAVVGLTRGAELPHGVEPVTGDPTRAGAWGEALAGCDVVIHLAGESLATHRWTAAHKAELRRSRLEGTRQVVSAMVAAERPRVLLSASGADYYPFDDSEQRYPEPQPAGRSFLADLCRDWEGAALAAAAKGKRVCVMRTGVVLGRGEGALARLTRIFKSFAGGPLGDGRQWFSWIHVDDVVGAYLHAADRDALSGPVNVVAGSTRQAEFARALGDALKRPSWLPVPGFALRVAIGELADYLLHGRRVVPAALEESGYEFSRPALVDALAASV
jgi:uncharacterized protein (TIGR01777 family)